MTTKPSRRAFMAATGAAAFAVGTSAARAAESGKRIRKAVKFAMIGEDLSVEDKFRLLQDLGFDGVELGMGDKVDPTEAVAAREKTGLPIHGVILGSVKGIENAVDRAVLYGATSVLIVAGRVDENMPYGRNWKETMAAIRAAKDHAAEKKIDLLLEDVWNNFLMSPLEMRRYVDEIGGIGVYFDVGNVVRFGYPEQWIPILGSRIRKLDIKEYSRDKQLNEGLWKGFNVKIGEGSIDWPAVCEALRKIDYRGWATAEVAGGDRTRLADIAARMDKVLKL